jgi:AcrR family transcriptional regulator
MSSPEQRKSTAGRRRDPDIEPRVYEAAVRVYAREGWSGFTFDSVARESKVGKPSIYRRWSSREELLVRAMDRMAFPTARDCGSLRADLIDYALQFVEWYADPDRGRAGLHLNADCLSNPTLSQVWEQVVAGPKIEAARGITRRAVDRGEIGPDGHSATIAELLVGAMGNHWMFTPESAHARLRTTFPRHAEALVDVILNGVLAGADGDVAERAPAAAQRPRKRAGRPRVAADPTDTRVRKGA